MDKHNNSTIIPNYPFSAMPTLCVSGVDLKRDPKVYKRGFPGLFRNLMRYHDRHGAFPRINDPLTFNDKIWYRLLYDRRQIFTVLADKFVVRDFVSININRIILPKLYFSTDNSDNIQFKSLPDSFIVKANHGSGWTYIVPDKSKADFQRITKYCRSWLQQNYYDRKGEWAYKNIKPKIIIEELLTYKNKLPEDYKFFCFGGNVAAIQIDIDRFGRHETQFVTPDWKVLTPYSVDCQNDASLPKPRNLISMIEVAEKLSQSFDFLRVDLFNLNGCIYFGEITVYPGAGVGKLIHGKLDSYLGRLWKIDINTQQVEQQPFDYINLISSRQKGFNLF